MKIGIPKEIKLAENRVGITPSGVREYVSQGHEVYVEREAGLGSGFKCEEYEKAGAKLCTQEQAWACDMVIKVKEPLEAEYKFFREGLILYAYLHLAAEPKLTKALIDAKVTAIAFETVSVNGALPLLRPMSEVAGRRGVLMGAYFLEKINGGKGKLIGGIPGVEPANVAVIGGGVAGYSAAITAAGMGANVTIIEYNEDRIRYLYDVSPKNMKVLKSTEQTIYNAVKDADIVVSTVLIPGAKAPKLVKEYMVKEMEEGSVIVDISIDQGGSVETVDRVTYNDDPTYVKHGVIHYSVGNMPGATPMTSTVGLENATLQYGLQLAKQGLEVFKMSNPLLAGLNTYKGNIVNQAVATSLDLEHVNPNTLF